MIIAATQTVCVCALPAHGLCLCTLRERACRTCHALRSNPDRLHVCVCSQFKWLEQTLLLIFTSLFFVGRILMAPAKYIPSFKHLQKTEPQSGARILLAILAAVFVIQVYWFSVLITRLRHMVRPGARAKAKHMASVVLQRHPSKLH